MAEPAAFGAAVLVPENPENVLSWHDHFTAVRRRWYLGFAVWGVAAATSAWVNLAMPFTHRARVVHVSALLLGLLGALSSRTRVHAVIVTLIALMLVAGALNPTINADWLK